MTVLEVILVHSFIFSHFIIAFVAVCPRGWVSHVIDGADNVYCYLVRLNTLTWDLARKDCINSNSELLSIANAQEQEFVTKHLLARSFMWIGYNDLDREGAWTWSDRYFVCHGGNLNKQYLY